MAIWFDKQVSLKDIENIGAITMVEFLDMKWVEIGDDFLTMSMPVINKTKQAYGFLHGGASCVLAETVGSIASALVMDRSKSYCVGIEINANHLRSVTKGTVTGTARPLHLGKSIHVWDIKMHDDEGNMFCVSRLTVAIRPIEKLKV